MASSPRSFKHEDIMGRACSSSLDRRMRTRTYGGVGRVPGNGHLYPILPIFCSAGTKDRIASGAKSAPLGQQTVLQTGSRVNFANILGSRSGSKTGPDSSGRKSTVASQPSLNITKSEAGPASSAWSICKIIAINPKVQLGVKAAVPAQEPSPRATRRVESHITQQPISPHFLAVVLPVFHRCECR